LVQVVSSGTAGYGLLLTGHIGVSGNAFDLYSVGS
jgi:hypothetical protein